MNRDQSLTIDSAHLHRVGSGGKMAYIRNEKHESFVSELQEVLIELSCDLGSQWVLSELDSPLLEEATPNLIRIFCPYPHIEIPVARCVGFVQHFARCQHVGDVFASNACKEAANEEMLIQQLWQYAALARASPTNVRCHAAICSLNSEIRAT